MEDNAAQQIRDAAYTYTSEILPSQYRDVMADHGDKRIVSASIHRRPIPGAIERFGNVATLGQLSQAKSRLNYDSWFHTWLNVELSDGTWISTDKQHYLTAKAASNGPPLGVGVDKGADVASLKGQTFRQMTVRAIDRAGSINALATYHPKTANCQQFIQSLIGPEALTPDAKRYLVQDTSQALSDTLAGAAGKVVSFAGFFGPDRDLNRLQRESDLHLGIGGPRPLAKAAHRPSGERSREERIARGKETSKQGVDTARELGRLYERVSTFAKARG